MRFVSSSEWLRPWTNLGVEFFLAPYPVDMDTPAYPLVKEDRTPPSTRDIRDSRLKRAELSKSSDSQKSSPSRPAGKALSQDTPNADKDKIKKQTQLREFQAIEHDGVDWPSLYKDIFSKITPGPVLWTYSSLGHDLTGNAEAARSQCLKSLMQALSFPRGTSVFWPYSLPEKGELVENLPVFYSGMQKLTPRIIIVVGQSGMVPFKDYINITVPFTQSVFQVNRRIILLPEFTQLISTPSLVERSADYLRASIGTLPLSR